MYRQLVAILRAQIESGELPPGRAIPAESRLESIHGVSRDTVRKAVRILREDGWVETVWAKGTYVVDRSAEQVEE